MGLVNTLYFLVFVSYSVFGVSNGIAAATSFTVYPSSMLTDSAGYPLSTTTYSEYAAVGSAVTVNLTEYQPYHEFEITDTGLLTTPYASMLSDNLGVYYYYGIISVTITQGSFNPYTMNFARMVRVFLH
jgi:hypothetical protein